MSTLWAKSNLSLLGCRRSWEGLRLVTEQGKQLALNSERIASLYGVEGYRLAPNRYSGDFGANIPFAIINLSIKVYIFCVSILILLSRRFINHILFSDS